MTGDLYSSNSPVSKKKGADEAQKKSGWHYPTAFPK